jgi:predicted metal-dependent peptidase
MNTMTKIPRSITETRTALSVSAVFFAVIMFREATVVWSQPDGSGLPFPVPTACTDGKRIYFNMNFFENELKSLSERTFVMGHEVYHVMAGHPQKMKRYAFSGLFGRPFYPDLMNWCMDAVINKTLIESAIGTAPASAVLHPDVAAGELVEDVYERFLKDIPESNDRKAVGIGMPDDDDTGEGGTQPGSSNDLGGGQSAEDMGFKGEMQDSLADPQADAPDEQKLRNAVAAAATAQKMAGSIPAGLKSFIDEVLEPAMDWREELRDYFVTTVGKDESSWKRPNRRKLVLPGIYMPRRIGLRCGPVVIGFDTSGSMSDLDIGAILTEACGILTDVRPLSCHVVWCDAVVERVDEVEEASELIELTRTEGVPGRGGTKFDPVFEWVEEADLETPPAVLIYGTDGYPNGWPKEGICDYPVIWLMTTDVIAPWGITLKVQV